jgi:beta-N-acetylhexosaminidase
MVGVTGAADAPAVIADQHVGGIFIGSWTDPTMLTSGAAQAITATSKPLPVAVSVDEEGSRVQRLAGLIGPQLSARELARSDSPQQVHDIALVRGRKVKDLGITIDFAPVADVSAVPDNSVIGDRSFCADPSTVTTFARAYARGRAMRACCRRSSTSEVTATAPVIPALEESAHRRWTS